MLKQLKDAAKCVLIMPVFGLIAVTAIYLAGLLVSSPYIAIMYIFREYDYYLYDPVVWSNTELFLGVPGITGGVITIITLIIMMDKVE